MEIIIPPNTPGPKLKDTEDIEIEKDGEKLGTAGANAKEMLQWARKFCAEQGLDYPKNKQAAAQVLTDAGYTVQTKKGKTDIFGRHEHRENGNNGNGNGRSKKE